MGMPRLLRLSATNAPKTGQSLGLVVIGPPLSGRGTQAARLRRRYGVKTITIGELLRREVNEKTPVGVQIAEYVERGDLVPDEVVIDYVLDRIREEEEDTSSTGWILEGFPRTKEQAKALTDSGAVVDCVVKLNIPDEGSVTRMQGRRIDPVTEEIFNVDTFPASDARVQARLVQREDDSEDQVRKRVQVYRSNEADISSYYSDVLLDVDASQSQDDLFVSIEAGIESARRSIPGLVELDTEPIQGMKMGTSGLRKKVSVASEGKFLLNFVQSIFDALDPEEFKSGTLVLGGDGRYYNSAALQEIIRIAAANGVGRIWVGKDGLLSTPAASAVIREREDGAAFGGIILTASHNPGGPNGDFGIKYNTGDGAPAKEDLTQRIYEMTTKVSQIKTLENTPPVDLSTVGSRRLGKTVVEVIDPIEDHLQVLRQCFDFRAIASLIARPDFSFLFDAMHGAAGPTAKRVFLDELGASPDSLTRCDIKEDFGGLHPDPNLAYAEDLVQRMGLDKSGAPLQGSDGSHVPVFGAAADGDGDRNMILGRGFFVTPSDSVAVLAANHECIPQFANGLNGVARSMPTSQALDAVAIDLTILNYETPTGWKFFGNLMDVPQLQPFLCGEESFGTGSNHIREKDGIWAVLAWLQVLAHRNKDPSSPLVTVRDIVEEHWVRFGRYYYSRFDYEGVDSDKADAVMDHIRDQMETLAEERGLNFAGLMCNSISDFVYEDPTDDSITLNQGLLLKFGDYSRAVLRLSGTGSEGATVRLYLETFEDRGDRLNLPVQEVLAPVIEAALEASNLRELTGRDEPTVIT